MNAHRQLQLNQFSATKSIERLSSGMRINRAGDDAAGLAISEKMRGQIRGLKQATRNAQDAISMVQTAEGALNETHSILQRMRELAVQASNDTLSTEDRLSIGDELVQLKDEINRISATTKFNGKGVLNGDLTTSLDGASVIQTGAVLNNNSTISAVDVSKAQENTVYTLAAGANAGEVTLSAVIAGNAVSETVTLAANSQTVSFASMGVSFDIAGTETAANLAAALVGDTITTAAGSSAASFLIGSNGVAAENLNVSFAKMDATTLGSGGVNQISDKVVNNTAVDTKTKADALIAVLDDAVVDVSTQRSSLGAAQNRLEHTISNLGTSTENLQAAESRIRDLDMAEEMMTFTKNNILQQAATAMLAQANMAPQSVLQLLG